MLAAPVPRLLAAAIVALVLVAGCSSTPDEQERKSEPQYLAIGDSYAAGYRPAVDGGVAENTTDGFAWRVADATGLELVNVSCSGITAVDFVSGDPCQEDLRAPGALPPVGGSELATALAHLDRHGDDVELVTVVLGANDLRACAFDTGWRECVADVVPRATRALDTVLAQLRERLGPDVPIVGLTYPDVWLGAPVLAPDSREAATIADASVELFRSLLNPALERTYAAHGARFADVTRAFGAYLPVERTTSSEEFGTLPARTARICDETYYCALADPHPTPEGHERIADLVVATAQD